MIFTHPACLLMALPLAAALLLWRPPSRGVRLLRTAILAAIVLALAGLAVKIPSNDGVLVLLVDRSESMPDDITASATEAVSILSANRPEKSRLGVVSFAETAQIEELPANNEFNGFLADLSGDQSRLAPALEKALGLIPDGAPGRILLLTDGDWTGSNPAPVFAEAAARGIAVDYRSFRRPSGGDLAVSAVSAPHSAVAGEFYSIGVQIDSPSSERVKYQILKDGRPMANGTLKLHAGKNRFFFRDKGDSPAVFRYEFRISPGKTPDPRPENNRASFLVRIEGRRPVLLLTMNKRSGLGAVLRKGGMNIKTANPETVRFSFGSLSAYSGIILENVPASKIGDAGMRLIAKLALRGGSGVMMTGGKNSYGLGGYYKSPLEPILPVSMELRREHRELAMSIVVALDRSGSMGVTVGSGETKMDLANISTVEVLKLLSSNDEFGVIAVDSAPHTIVCLSKAEDKAGMEERIRSIDSMGGGIFVYEALVAATRMQMKSSAGTRHIILFADAADAEQPGRYKALLEKTTKAGITVSVVGLGLPTDSDAEFLRDVARRGKGRCLFSADPRELPRLFAQDTFVIARNTFIDKPVSAKFAGAVRMLSPLGFGDAMPLGGYNLCYARPKAMIGAVSKDEFKAPIIAFWRRGLGRVVCFAGEMDGKYTGKFATWPQAGNLTAAMAGWMAGLKNKGLPDGVMATQKIENGVNHIQLLLDPERKADPFGKIPEIVILSGRPGRDPNSKIVKLHWETPDSLGCEVPMRSDEVYLATLRSDSFPPVTLPPVKLPYPPEFKPSNHHSGDDADVFSLCRGTGGRERINLADVWNELPSRSRYYPLSSWLLLAAVLLLLLEVLERRGVSLLKWPTATFAKIAESIKARRQTSRETRETAPASSRDTPPPSPASGAEAAASVISAERRSPDSESSKPEKLHATKRKNQKREHNPGAPPNKNSNRFSDQENETNEPSSLSDALRRLKQNRRK